MAKCARIGRDRGKRVYSDLGFIQLGLLVSEVTGSTLDRFCKKEIFEPMGLTGTGFFDLASSHREPFEQGRRILPTGQTRPREPAPGQEALYKVPEQEPLLDPGQVDDDNAWAMGGVAGHAGLFSTAEDLAGFGWALQEELGGADLLGSGETFREFAAPDLSTRGARRGLGFDMPADEGSLSGSLLGQEGPLGAIGHLGFTGCSLWLDRDRRLVVALVTNRVFPSRANVDGIRIFRPEFHDAVVRICGG
jgi:CubicO group peptidase (beta-lactamase class C family)